MCSLSATGARNTAGRARACVRACVRARWHGRACSRVSLETGGSTPKPSHVSRITLVGCVSVSAGIFAFLRACVVLPPQTAWRES